MAKNASKKNARRENAKKGREWLGCRFGLPEGAGPLQEDLQLRGNILGKNKGRNLTEVKSHPLVEWKKIRK